MIPTASIYQPMPHPAKMTPEQASNTQQMQDLTKEQMDQSLWAAAQGLALNKLKMFHSIAKQVNDQQ
jgi:hypothetical protein